MNKPLAPPVFTATQPIHYPESDGAPMGETDFHITVILYLRQALRFLFRHAEQTYVAANMFFYYEEGNPAAVTAPDVFVVKGIPKHDRRIYKLWEEKVAPCTVFEITSRSSRLEDLGTKRALYEMLGVKEYFLFDPLSEYLSPPLQGFEREEGLYRPLPLSAEGTLFSRELNIILKPEGSLLRVVNADTGEPLPTLDEAVELAHQEMERARLEAQRAEAEAQRAEAAEAEAARLRAELERLRRQH
ncbi:MAG: Uma2 family endonuclease [Caldilineae bacterium]|nr:MAG: Uma2 family endonuclease [Caldilineae bacterium]